MAVRESVSNNGGASRRRWFIAASLVVLFVAALFLRAYWNLEAAHPSDAEFILSGGSDPYYHKRAADAIQSSGFHHHLVDPLLNYPAGSENPNPPLYEWVIAAGGQILDPLLGGDVGKATWQVAIWSPAVFGALTLFPIYFLGAALFDRRAGLVAAFLWVVSTSAIDAGGVGLADHDSAVIFFATTAFLFYIQTIRHFRAEGSWVQKWSSIPTIAPGLARLVRERGTGFAYALLTAVSIAAVALTWKGFNYVLGTIFLYACAQMVVDHWRSRDSTGLFLGTLFALVPAVLIAYPYYATANVANFLQPTWYILAAFILAGLVLVPTRDLPTILVFPIALVTAFLAALVAFFVFPSVSQSLLYATVYFKQTRLYETIAEAHPADFSTIAFGIGPLAFFLAVGGWFLLLFRVAGKRVQATIATVGFLALALIAYVFASQVGSGAAATPIVGIILLTWLLVMFSMGDTPVGRTHAFAILWAAIAIFMATNAVRFLSNAIPVLALFGAFMAVWVLDWLDFGAIRKTLAANRGNMWQGLRKGTRPLHVVSVILIALLFVFPTTLLAADAALPPEAEDKLARDAQSDFARNFFTSRMGAYGGGFSSVKPWIAPLEWLDQHDANTTDLAKRPAFLAWWDYGHWAIAIGRHPTVADNFQNGYEFAANFILSQNETAAIQLLVARTSEAKGADLEAALTQVGSTNAQADAADIRAWKTVGSLSLSQSAELLSIVEQQTGKSIRYFATDIRMLPYDNPETSNIDQSSIFYAPVTLKGEKPDTYVTTQVNMGQAVAGAPDGYVTLDQYREFAKNPIRETQAVGERLAYQQPFFNSMFWRAYVGTNVQTQEPVIQGSDVEMALGNPRPAGGLEHFRVVYISEIQRLYKGGDPADARSYIYYPGVMIIEYTPGAIVEGTVTEDGVPVAGAVVTAYDDAGTLLANAFQSTVDPSQFHIPHAQAITGADGKYTILAPFALEGGSVTLDAARAGVSIGTAHVSITREQAAARQRFTDVAITVQHGSVNGVAYLDNDGDGAYNASNDAPAASMALTIGSVSVTTDGEGRFNATDVSAGAQNVTTSASDLQVVASSSRVRVQPASAVTFNVGLEAKSASVAGRLVADMNGDGTIGENETLAFESVSFTADSTVTPNTARTTNAFTQADGNFTLTLRPGTYTVTATHADSTSGDVFRLERTLTLAPGEALAAEEFVAVKEQPAP